MKKRLSNKIDTDISNHKMTENLRDLSHQVLYYANRGIPRIDFMREVTRMLIDFSGCDVVEMRIKRSDKYFLCEAVRGNKVSFRIDHLSCEQIEKDKMIPCSQSDSGIETLCHNIMLNKFDSSSPFFTKNGSFWTSNLDDLLTTQSNNLRLDSEYKSIALFPLVVNEENMGLLQLKSKQPGYFTEKEVELYEGFAQTLGVALAHRNVQVAVRERIKELTCLYGIAKLAARTDLSLDQILQRIAELLPPAWLYPEIASGKIRLNGHSYITPGFREGLYNQKSNIVVKGHKRGLVEVTYIEERPELDEGPFLKEERSLIDTIAKEVALIIERRQAEEEKISLQNQLMHADRLATIGQLAAGVAHELNEPLSNILGFTQLAKKIHKLPKQTAEDLEKIESASLHAREIVKKLVIFARQMPPKKTRVNLNQLVEEELYFFESRCAKEGIELVRLLAPKLPKIIADAGQLHQVLVNLVVNSIQAMPKGGKLTIQTTVEDGYISLIVEDTGIGMSEGVLRHLFVPFFTTKEVGEGTGLGLSVVHGIVSSHQGSIKVKSEVGKGTSFEIHLPIKTKQHPKENI
jgi:two-component system NtrC family sensor kinase